MVLDNSYSAFRFNIFVIDNQHDFHDIYLANS
jgi:hypothetical protein